MQPDAHEYVRMIAEIEHAQIQGLKRRVIAHGEGKNCPPWREQPDDYHLEKAQRHLARHRHGEFIDPDSGEPSLIHAILRLEMTLMNILRREKQPKRRECMCSEAG